MQQQTLLLTFPITTISLHHENVIMKLTGHLKVEFNFLLDVSVKCHNTFRPRHFDDSIKPLYSEIGTFSS